MKKLVLLYIVALTSITITAQTTAIGEWKDHLSYQSAVSVAEGNGKVFCATKGGLFTLKKGDNSLERLTKINGLSDVEPTVVNFNRQNNKLIISYKNSNIDIIDASGSIYNISDIKRKNIVGNKGINNIFIENQYAYLACGFGIVVIDMDRLEVKDTYYIGVNATNVNVRDITTDGNYFYAASNLGIFKALKTSNLANFINWSLIPMPGLPVGTYNTVAYINGKLITNFSKVITSNQYYADTMYYYNGSTWNYFTVPSSYVINAIRNCNNTLVVSFEGVVLTYDENFNNNGYYGSYVNGTSASKFGIMDQANNVWIADDKFGLVSWQVAAGYFETHKPNGPGSINLNAISIKDGNMYVAPGSNISGSAYYIDGVYQYSNDNWTQIKGNYPGIVNLDTIYDIVNVLIDQNNPKHFYAASWKNGVIEFLNGTPIKLYNELNSSLQGLGLNGFDPIWCQGLAQDSDNNIWVTNSEVQSPLSVKRANGTWQSFDFSAITGAKPRMANIIVDKNNQKWMPLPFPTNGILVFKGGTTSTPNSSNTKKLSTLAGNGGLPSPSVTCITEDADGEIWIGTDKGIAVFYSPENVFTNQNFDAQQILIEQDGHVQILLETELIQDIAIDAANRKWIATANSGVFLMSADGTKQIHHFNESNSPLYTNNVRKITIDHSTGEVYFGTSKGILSYRGTATQGFEDFTDVYAFPNPVRENYDGPIAIKGLINNTTVKITDISGQLVYETKSEGGQALWYGKNFEGRRVSTGVYMVFLTNEDGSKKMATKILLIN